MIVGLDLGVCGILSTDIDGGQRLSKQLYAVGGYIYVPRTYCSQTKIVLRNTVNAQNNHRER